MTTTTPRFDHKDCAHAPDKQGRAICRRIRAEYARLGVIYTPDRKGADLDILRMIDDIEKGN